MWNITKDNETVVSLLSKKIDCWGGGGGGGGGGGVEVEAVRKVFVCSG